MLALALSVLVKVACLASFSSATGLVVLIAAHALSRAVIAYPLLAYSPVHEQLAHAVHHLRERNGQARDREIPAIAEYLGGFPRRGVM